MLIDRIFRKTKSFLNTDGIGNFSPSDFNIFLHDAIQSRYEELFSDINRVENYGNRGFISQYIANMEDQLREKLQYYMKSGTITATSPTVKTFPADLNYIDDIEQDNTGVTYDICESRREFNIIKTGAQPNYPVYYRSGNTAVISPEYTDPITVSYLRTPLIPNWTYQIDLNGNPIFDSGSNQFVDADIHPSEEDEMVRRVLLSFGVNLKERDGTSFAMAQENKEFNQQNRL